MIEEEKLAKFSVKFDEPLSKYTYTKVGGKADLLVFPRDTGEIIEIIRLAKKSDLPLTILGNASNLIVRDGGIRGVVVLLTELKKVSVSARSIEAEAGASLKEVTQIAQKNALSGFEFACGIPGSIGGAVYMNAGAYGGEISQILSSVKVYDWSRGEVREISAGGLDFGYRHSKISEEKWLVLSAKFELRAGNSEKIQEKMEELNQLRARKQPLEYPSCGSVFKRPVNHYAGPLIQEAGCQGHQIGGVQVSKKHAGFMINKGGGTGKDYEDLIHYVIETVKKQSGITLEPEVKIIGEK